MKKLIAGLFILSLVFSPGLVRAQPLTLEQTQAAAKNAKKKQANAQRRALKQTQKKKRQIEKRNLRMRKAADKNNERLMRSVQELGM